MRTLALVAALSIAAPATADEPAPTGGPASLTDRQTLTDDWFGLGRRLAESGVTFSLSATQVYQVNLRGGLATHRHAGRYAGSYDAELELDLERLLGLRGASMYVLAEGSWSDGLGDSSIQSLFGVNDDAGGDRSIDVTELWYQQSLLGGRVLVRAGKVDLTGGFECRGCPVGFDGSLFANDETAQFLNAALVNNPTVPLPDNGLGAMVYVQAAEAVYVAAGAADAQADARETGFRTALHGEDHLFAIFEAGVTPVFHCLSRPLPGAWRAGLWYDPQPKERFDGRGTERDDAGFYLTFDQTLFKESDDVDDPQGLGVFFRYGWADSDVAEIRCFWSVGAQYHGLVPGRDEDILGVGFASGSLVRRAGFDEPHESVLEVYYSVAIFPWLTVSPSIQYVANPGGGGAGDATVLGLRVQMAL